MKKIIALSIAAASFVFATNGDNMIGLGPESRALGGTGIALGMGADSVFKNPAWLVDTKGLEGMFGATIFMPTVKATITNPMMGNGVGVESKADMFMIPEISVTDHITDTLSYGFGMFGVSGMGVDYRNENPATGVASMRTNFQYMRFVPSLSYSVGDLRIGAGVTLAYGSLTMGAITPDGTGNPLTAAQRGGGVSEDFGFGFQIGAGYHVSDTITLGAYYQSKVETEYEGVFDFNFDGVYDNLKLSQPTEYGVGIAFKNGDLTLTADYRKILWSEADGYDNFGWADQDVFAVGAAYALGDLTLRAGYNYGESPLKDLETLAPTTPAIAQNIYFNMLGFPAFSDSHITLGFGYKISEKMGLDVAYVYAPEASIASPMGIEASNEQNALTFAIRYKFN